MTRPLRSALAVAACAVLVLAVGHLVAPLLTCSAGCAYHDLENRR